MFERSVGVWRSASSYQYALRAVAMRYGRDCRSHLLARPVRSQCVRAGRSCRLLLLFLFSRVRTFRGSRLHDFVAPRTSGWCECRSQAISREGERRKEEEEPFARVVPEIEHPLNPVKLGKTRVRGTFAPRSFSRGHRDQVGDCRVHGSDTFHLNSALLPRGVGRRRGIKTNTRGRQFRGNSLRTQESRAK